MKYKVFGKYIDDIDESIVLCEDGRIFIANEESISDLCNDISKINCNIGYGGDITEFNFNRKRLKKLILLLTSSCNMRCKYCYLSYGELATSEMNEYLDIHTIEKNIESLLNIYSDGIDYIEFFGGEPLLAYDNIKNVIELMKKICTEKGLKIPGYGLVTNGLLLSREKMKMFRDNNVAIMVSIDGTRELQDIVRVDKKGAGTYDRLSNTLEKLDLKKLHDINFELTINRTHLMTYKQGSARGWFNNLKKLGFRIGNIGIVEFSLDKNLDFKSTDENIFRNVEEEIVDYFFDELKTEDPIFHLDIMRILMKFMNKDFKPYSCGAGVSQATMTVDGKIIPCTKMIGKEFIIIDDRKFDNTYLKDIIENEFKQGCENCWLENICLGYCYATKYRKEETEEHVNNRCWHAKLLTEFIVKNLVKSQKMNESDLIRRGFSIFNDSIKKYNYRG